MKTSICLLLIGLAISVLGTKLSVLPGTCQMCGGFANIKCPNGLICVDDPNDDCNPAKGGRDCAGICVEPKPSKIREGVCTTCGGKRGLLCPNGLNCVDDPADDCDPKEGGADCTGFCRVCKTGMVAGECQFCGGFAGLKCPAGLLCVDDPNDNCDPNKGGRDCGGICVQPRKEKKGVCQFCGGIANIKCPEGFVCVDDPNDMCDPTRGGADCGGICIRP